MWETTGLMHYADAGQSLLIAAVLGGIIGLERAYHGRPAGFRTHILVCLASALLMQLVQYPWSAIPEAQLNSVRIDPTRMAQGIMTGIGFLGAGVIIHDKYVVRGLTTAASIWITASIGIIVGAGLYLIASLCGLITLGVLSVFRNLEDRIPARRYAKLKVASNNGERMTETELINIIQAHGLRHRAIAFRLHGDAKQIIYEVTLSAFQQEKFSALYQSLIDRKGIEQLSLTPLDS